ncbi:MAG TPA: ABC transporter permease subunit [Methylomirabilota bacterium]|nr:ABC transporter permease subunit [Methylomirabilota bacterium]
MRKLVNMALPALCGVCALLALVILAGIVAAIATRGLPAISTNFLLHEMKEAGVSGGILYNLLGTLLLIATGSLVAVPIAVALALVRCVYVTSPTKKRVTTLWLYLLNGTPSILFGIFGFILFVKVLGWGKSWLAGGILLGVMMIPTMAVALIDRIESIPRRYIEAAAGLGLSQRQIIWSVLLPQSAGSLLTGSFLGLARAAGETAPIMFTATIFAGATLPSGIKDSPVLTLPYHIFILAQDSFDPAASSRLWGAALVLLALVFGLSLLALPLRWRSHEEARND